MQRRRDKLFRRRKKPATGPLSGDVVQITATAAALSLSKHFKIAGEVNYDDERKNRTDRFKNANKNSQCSTCC